MNERANVNDLDLAKDLVPIEHDPEELEELPGASDPEEFEPQIRTNAPIPIEVPEADEIDQRLEVADRDDYDY